MSAPLAGLRVLLVEDEALVALLLEEMLDELGCRVVARAASVEEGLPAAEIETLDLAVLDINLGGDRVFPIAEKLAARNVPVVFSTGYGAASIPEAWRSCPLIGKPFAVRQLEAALRNALAGRTAATR